MDLPGLVTAQLGTEEPWTQVPLGGEDLLLVTPSRTLVYRAEGLLRDESVDSYSHDCDRVKLSTGRRKATLTFEYIDGPRNFSVPRDRVEDVLAPILRGVLSAAEVVAADERVEGVYRFSELTLIVTEGRVVKHVGGDLWSPDCETFPFDDVTGLNFEEGSVATAVVLEVDGRPDRIKAPNEDARYVRQDLERVLFDYHDVASLDELNRKIGRDDVADRPTMEFEEGLDSLVPERDDDASAEAADAEADIDPGVETGSSDPEDAEFEFGGGPARDRTPGADESRGGRDDSPAAEDAGGVDRIGDVGETSDDASRDAADTSNSSRAGDDEVAEQLAELTAAVEKQNEMLETQQRVIRLLIKELRQGR